MSAAPTPPRRTTRRSVRVAERLSRALVTLGGVGTIVAVSLVFVLLAWVVVPLFLPPSVEESGRVAAPEGWRDAPLSHLIVDEYLRLACACFGDGTVALFRLDDGKVLAQRSLVEGPPPTAVSFSARTGSFALGFADGTVRLGTASIVARHLAPEEVPEPLRGLRPAETAEHADGLLERTADDSFRHFTLATGVEDPVRIEPPSPVLLVDHTRREADSAFVAFTGDGRLVARRIRGRPNMITGKVAYTETGGQVVLPRREGRAPPRHLLLSGIGDSTYLVWESGHAVRLDTRDVTELVVAEILDLVPEPDARLTALRFLIGGTTLLVGDSRGRVRSWFPVKPPDVGTVDGATLVAAHEFEAGSAPVAALAASQRTRMFAAAYRDGSVRLFHATSGRMLGEARVPRDSPLRAIAIAPKDDALLGAGGSGVFLWNVDAPHPEITLSSLFLPVWYESHAGADHVWQSSSGTDDFEPKFGLWPLVFGTIKATVYSLLFGAPLAVLAAIFTSEFLSARAKARAKPVIEMMASLPSVVLGFLAAIVIAPWIEGYVPETLACFATVPFAFLLGAYLWQVLPGQGGGRARALRLPFLFAAAAAGVAGGFRIGPAVERGLFGGDIMRWLDDRTVPGLGGWMILLLPLSAVGVAFLMTAAVNPALWRMFADWEARRMAWFELAKFLAASAAALGLALLLSWLLAALGLDPRGTYVATYVQRNALVVGFVMGFAVIPIIYTISEDALSSVPQHLRSASLGAGATPWQTAVRVVIPTALSGIFSALMVGFGRAVGETMIVLMATGNTPVREWNIFNGFRTLSANIAVELPEAVQGSTHYRTLFLAALTLFAMTFLVNTAAELVRARVRRRAYEL